MSIVRIAKGLRVAQEPDQLYSICVFLSSGDASQISGKEREVFCANDTEAAIELAQLGQDDGFPKMQDGRKNACQAQSSWKRNRSTWNTSFFNGYRYQDKGSSGPSIGKLLEELALAAEFQKASRWKRNAHDRRAWRDAFPLRGLMRVCPRWRTAGMPEQAPQARRAAKRNRHVFCLAGAIAA